MSVAITQKSIIGLVRTSCIRRHVHAFFMWNVSFMVYFVQLREFSLKGT